MNRETIIQGLFRRPMDPNPEADAVSFTDIGLCLIGGEDADREMIGDDSFFIDNIGNK